MDFWALNSDLTPKISIPNFRVVPDMIDASAYGSLVLDTSKYKKITIGSIVATDITFVYARLYEGESSSGVIPIHLFSVSSSPQVFDVSNYDCVTISLYGLDATVAYGSIRANNITLE